MPDLSPEEEPGDRPPMKSSPRADRLPRQDPGDALHREIAGADDDGTMSNSIVARVEGVQGEALPNLSPEEEPGDRPPMKRPRRADRLPRQYPGDALPQMPCSVCSAIGGWDTDERYGALCSGACALQARQRPRSHAAGSGRRGASQQSAGEQREEIFPLSSAAGAPLDDVGVGAAEGGRGAVDVSAWMKRAPQEASGAGETEAPTFPSRAPQYFVESPRSKPAPGDEGVRAMVAALWIRRERKSASWDRRQRLGEVVDQNASLRGTPSSSAERPAELMLTVPRAGLATRSLLPAQARAEPAAIGEMKMSRPWWRCEPEVPTTLSATDVEDVQWLRRQLRDGTLTDLQQVREPTEAELAQARAEIEGEQLLRNPRPIPIRPAGWIATAVPGAQVQWHSLLRVRSAQRRNRTLED